MQFKKSLFYLAAISLVFFACEKAAELPYYGEGNAVTLSASATTIAPAPADSNNVVLTLSWTDPGYAIDSARVKYIVEVDNAGNQFKSPLQIELLGKYDTSFLAKQLNAFALAHGGDFNKPQKMEARVVSSYENNNDQKISNTVPFTFTPYKVPPKISLPASGHLFLVGDATIGGWTNPVPVPSQEFSQVDETTFAGVFYLQGGGSYLVLPENGNWGKYSIADASADGASEGGAFGPELKDNIPGPANAGWYKIVLDFQHGRYTVTSWSGNLPENLYIVGDATPGGWNNPVPVPSQQFTRINSSQYELTIQLNGGKQYLMLPVNGSWDHKYAVQDDQAAGLPLTGAIGYDLPKNIPGPQADGTYKITVNFAKGVQGEINVVKQ